MQRFYMEIRNKLNCFSKQFKKTTPLYNVCVKALYSCLAQLVERKTLNLVVVGSSPTVGIFLIHMHPYLAQLVERKNFKYCGRGFDSRSGELLML